MAEAARVLHVDDDPQFAELAATYVQREVAWLAVDVVDGADAGLERLAEGGYECVVSDYEMPGTDGIAFLEAVREEWPDLPFVLFTGNGDEAVASDAISAGVTDYMQKGTGTDQYAVLANRVANAIERCRTERALERSRDRMRFALEHHDAVVWERDVETDTLRTFPDADVAHESLETTPLDGFGRIHPDDRAAVEATARAALEEGAPYDLEHRTRTEEGTRWLREQGRPALEGGTVTHLTGITRDVTEQKRRERAHQRRVEGFEAMGGYIAEDIGGTVRSAREQLAAAVEDGDPERAGTALSTLERLETQVDALAATMRAGDVSDDHREVDIGAVAADAWAALDGDADALTVAGDPQAVGDDAAVRQLLDDLLGNVRDHATDAVARVGALADGFYVEDDGPGVPADERERVFEPGYSTAGAEGLGLTRARQVAVAHGWRIETADPEALDGARFEVHTGP